MDLMYFLVKGHQWAYEREWRILAPLDLAPTIVDGPRRTARPTTRPCSP
jgi:hypothetical protein